MNKTLATLLSFKITKSCTPMYNDLLLLHFSVSIILGVLQVFKKETPIQSWGQSPLAALPSPLTWEKEYNLLLHWIGNQKNCKKIIKLI